MPPWPGTPRSPCAGLASGPDLSLLTEQSDKFFGDDDHHYTLKEVLGEGSYGSVYRCKRTADSAVCAVKIIDPRRLGFVGGEDGVRAVEGMAQREVEAMRQLAGHPGIVALEGAFRSDTTRQIFIVTEFAPMGHLFLSLLQRGRRFAEPEVAYILVQLLDALAFCHGREIVHGDLKLENVLVTKVDVRPASAQMSEELHTVKICDFGFAKSLHDDASSPCEATPLFRGAQIANYAAPELTLDTMEPASELCLYDPFKADVFSLGVMAFVMLCFSYPAKNAGEGAHRNHKCWDALSEDCRCFLDGLMATDPSKRMDLDQANACDWLKLAPLDAPPSSPLPSLRFKECSSDVIMEPALRGEAQAKLKGVLALQRTFKMMQQERAMACWALAGAPDNDGISCEDQFRSHVELTDKRLAQATDLLRDGKLELGDALSDAKLALAKARRLCFSSVEEIHVGSPRLPTSQSPAPWLQASLFADRDRVALAYNNAIIVVIDVVASTLEATDPGNYEVRRVVRRYRIFSTALEQLGRERSFISGRTRFTLEEMRRLGEILGARKMLLGTVVSNTSTNGTQMPGGTVVASSTGLIGTLLSDDEPSLLTANEVAALESLEERVITGSDDTLPVVELYRILTRFMTGLQSRIVMDIVNGVELAMAIPGEDFLERQTSDLCGLAENDTSKVPSRHAQADRGCAAGMSKLWARFAGSR